MRLEWRNPRRRSPISLTPLIDVVFILLLFFLLTSHFHQWRAIRVDATETTLAEAEDSATPVLLIRLHADGRADLGDEALDNAALIQRLRDSLRLRPQTQVSIQPDAEVDLQTLVALMDLIAASGVHRVSLQ